MTTTPLYKLKDYKETFKFEKEHPKELRWDDRYKLFMLQDSSKCQGIWLKDKTDIIGEIILSWQSSNVVNIDSFTVMPSHRGQGVGHDLVRLSMDWASDFKYEYITGEARKGASWKIFENFGATPILTYKDWGGTKEEYMSFKLEL
jgi:GNAT superfamily N-acetyltransferase